MSNCRANADRMRGFTMIQLMIALTIVAILTGVAIPSYKYITNTSRIAGEINNLLGDMQYARFQAIKQGQTITICSSTTGTSCTGVSGTTWNTGWIVFDDANGNGTVDAGESVIRVQQAFTGTDTLTTTVGSDVQPRGLSGRARQCRDRDAALLARHQPVDALPPGRHQRPDPHRAGRHGILLMSPNPKREAGFTLVEVLVSLVIISIGLLGIAKMEAVALSGTGVAQQRSIAAIEAASLAASMHADRAYWNSAAAPTSFTISGTTISNSTLATAVDCVYGDAGTSAPCSPTLTAAYDLQQWAKNVNGAPSYNDPSKPASTPSPLPLNPALPYQVTTVTCTISTTAATSCTIQIAWARTSWP